MKTTHNYLAADNPALWFLGTWTIAIIVWVLAPSAVVYNFFPYGRHVSFLAILYFVLCIAFFITGYTIAMKYTGNKRYAFFKTILRQDPKLVSRILRISLKISYPFLTIAVLSTILHFYLCIIIRKITANYIIFYYCSNISKC